MFFIKKIKGYFIRKHAVKIRKKELFMSMMSLKWSWEKNKKLFIELKNKSTEEIAYEFAEKDNFSKNSEFYWFKAEKFKKDTEEYIIFQDEEIKNVIKSTKSLIIDL